VIVNIFEFLMNFSGENFNISDRLDQISEFTKEDADLCHDLRKLRGNFLIPGKNYRVSEGKIFHVAIESTAGKYKSAVAKTLKFQAWLTKNGNSYRVDSMSRTSEYGKEKCHANLKNKRAVEFCACKGEHKFN
jgi:hypothetical protein